MAEKKERSAVTAISTSDLHSINVRGKELARDLIGVVSFTDHFWLLVTGELPTDDQRFVLDAVLVAISEHGLVTSNQAARMTLAAAPDAFQGAVAAGILGCGSVVLGASEAAGRFLTRVAERCDHGEGELQAAIRAELSEMRGKRQPVPGYGHHQHPDGDPRAKRLFELAHARGVAGRYVAIAEAAEPIAQEVYGRFLPVNVSGAIPAVMLDAGFPTGAMKGIPILARTASLIAHLHEEASKPMGFILSRTAAEVVEYDGLPLGQSVHS